MQERDSFPDADAPAPVEDSGSDRSGAQAEPSSREWQPAASRADPRGESRWREEAGPASSGRGQQIGERQQQQPRRGRGGGRGGNRGGGGGWSSSNGNGWASLDTGQELLCNRLKPWGLHGCETLWPVCAPGGAADDWSELGSWDEGGAATSDSSAAWQQAEDSWLGGALAEEEEEVESVEPWQVEAVTQEAEFDIMSGRRLSGAQVCASCSHAFELVSHDMHGACLTCRAFRA